MTKQPFTLAGKISGATHRYIYMRFLSGSDASRNDSAEIKNGAFVFKGALSEPARVFLNFPTTRVIGDEENPNIVDFYIEPGEQTITLAQDHFKEMSISGSASQEEYKRYMKIFDGVDGSSASGEDLSMQAARNFIRQNPGSFISINELDSWGSRFPLDSIKDLYRLISSDWKSSVAGRNVAQFIKEQEDNAAGKTAKQFSGRDLKGETISLNDFRGRYVLIDFWGSWCVPCRKKMPDLIELYNKYRSQGFEVIAIAEESTKSDSAWKAAVVKDGTGIWHNLRSGRKYTDNAESDERESIVKAYAIHSFPTTLLLDKSGKILLRFSGSDKQEELEKMLREIYGK